MNLRKKKSKKRGKNYYRDFWLILISVTNSEGEGYDFNNDDLLHLIMGENNLLKDGKGNFKSSESNSIFLWNVYLLDPRGKSLQTNWNWHQSEGKWQ